MLGILWSSSRQDSLPANLQGVWADGLRAPWNGDYHLNINLQMTYWASSSSNLGDSASVLAPFLKGLVAKGATTAKDWYGVEKVGSPTAIRMVARRKGFGREQVGVVCHLRRLGGVATR